MNTGNTGNGVNIGNVNGGAGKKKSDDMFKLRLVKETFHPASFKKLEWLPKNLVDKDYGWYYITLETNDM